MAKQNKPVQVVDPTVEIGSPTFAATDPRFRRANRNAPAQIHRGTVGGLDNTLAIMVTQTWKAIGGAVEDVSLVMYKKKKKTETNKRMNDQIQKTYDHAENERFWKQADDLMERDALGLQDTEISMGKGEWQETVDSYFDRGSAYLDRAEKGASLEGSQVERYIEDD